MIPYEILIRGDKDGKLSGSHCIDTHGADARPITPEDLADIAPTINAAAIAETKELEAKHAAAIATKDAEIATKDAEHSAALAAKADEIASLTATKDAEIATLQTQFAELNAYKTAMEAQVTAVIKSGDPAQYEALALAFLTPAQERERQEKLAKIAELEAETEAIKATLS